MVWDTYKSIFESIKINKKLEETFTTTIEKTVAFAIKYNRKSELRRYLDI